MVDKVEANRNLSNAQAIETVLTGLLNNHGGNAESLLKATKTKLQDTRNQISGLKAVLK